jgi:hypothetical protein
LGLVCTGILMGCDSDGDDTIEIHGLASLAAADGAALEGLVLDFPNATIFGFPGEAATLEVGDEAATFTLTTSGGTVINGTISPGAMPSVSCRLTQHAGEVGMGEDPFDEEYDACEATAASEGDIAFGSSGPGTVILSLISRAGETPVASDPENVTLNLREDNTVTINSNETPI